jgi:hypothetical protein
MVRVQASSIGRNSLAILLLAERSTEEIGWNGPHDGSLLTECARKNDPTVQLRAVLPQCAQ